MKKKQETSESYAHREILTRKQAADFFQVSERTIDNWTELGYIDAHKSGVRLKHYYKADLLKFLNSN